MARQESIRVISGAARGAGAMAFEAIGTNVAAGAARGRCRCHSRVPVGKVVTVRGRGYMAAPELVAEEAS